jgi:cold shock CspA family protein
MNLPLQITFHGLDPSAALEAAVREHVARGYGFIETADGREIYFHRNSILNDDFGRLRIGAAVRFAEESGDRDPQASSVWVHG